jgi:membrane-associated phospholipid phosphatase
VNSDLRYLLTMAACLALIVVAGASIPNRPLRRIDLEGLALRGRGTPVAVAFTRSGYWPALAGLSVVLVATAAVTREWRAFALALPAMQLLGQAVVSRIKAVYKRIRPDDWLYHQEHGYSFPSGHATTAVVFFGGLIVYLWHVPMPAPLRVTATLLAAIWVLGIPWSRLVLAAHYATDVISGMLFGVAWLALMLLVLRHLPFTHSPA